MQTYDDHYIPFASETEANTVLPFGSYPNIIQLHDGLGAVWRGIRLPVGQMPRAEHLSLVRTPPLFQNNVWASTDIGVVS